MIASSFPLLAPFETKKLISYLSFYEITNYELQTKMFSNRTQRMHREE